MSSITNHPQYAGSSNDIALVKIQTQDKHFFSTKENQVKLTETVDLSIYTPVCLPRRADYTGLETTVIGWGDTSTNRMPGEPPKTKAVREENRF